jgi:hypothetical protein
MHSLDVGHVPPTLHGTERAPASALNWIPSSVNARFEVSETPARQVDTT